MQTPFPHTTRRRILGEMPFENLGGVRHHRPKLEAAEAPSSVADAVMSIENRPLFERVDGQRHEEHQRQ